MEADETLGGDGEEFEAIVYDLALEANVNDTGIALAMMWKKLISEGLTEDAATQLTIAWFVDETSGS